MPVLIIRFPDGTKEFRYPDRPLEVGDAIVHDGVRYHVNSVSEDAEGDQLTVTVEPASLGDLLGSEEGAARVLVPAE
jgi:hypothetical protein